MSGLTMTPEQRLARIENALRALMALHDCASTPGSLDSGTSERASEIQRRRGPSDPFRATLFRTPR